MMYGTDHTKVTYSALGRFVSDNTNKLSSLPLLLFLLFYVMFLVSGTRCYQHFFYSKCYLTIMPFHGRIIFNHVEGDNDLSWLWK